MEKLTENMIHWAESKLGSTEYAGWCLAFIEDALEISNHPCPDYGADLRCAGVEAAGLWQNAVGLFFGKSNGDGLWRRPV